jgi:LAS superfamily LD-carboxypeptidase LdcB
MNKKTYLLRTSNVIKGCEKTEVSLGAGAIPRSLIRPYELDKQLMYRFKAAQAAAKKDGQIIYIVSGYRTLGRQKTLFENAVRKYGSVAEASKWVAPPLVSHHPWGTAIDVNYPDEPVGAGWLEVHGYKFGLCRVFENEWWHFEPVIAPGWKCPALVPDATYSLN